MIKTEQEFKQARLKYQEGVQQLQRQIDGMKVRDYDQEEINCVTGCTTRMLEENRLALELYKRLKARDLTALQDLPLNRQLIGLRIFLGLSQSKLASLLEVSRSEVARDERNDYRDLTLSRYEQILRAMGVSLVPAYVKGDWQDARKVAAELVHLAQADPGKLIIG